MVNVKLHDHGPPGFEGKTFERFWQYMGMTATKNIFTMYKSISTLSKNNIKFSFDWPKGFRRCLKVMFMLNSNLAGTVNPWVIFFFFKYIIFCRFGHFPH